MADFQYIPVDRLITVRAFLYSPKTVLHGNFILDTGASMTMVSTDRIDLLGYSARDASGFSTVSSPVGREKGYRLKLAAFEALGQRLEDFEVACHDLGLQHIDGLIGMNFLEQFRFCINPTKHVISID